MEQLSLKGLISAHAQNTLHTLLMVVLLVTTKCQNMYVDSCTQTGTQCSGTVESEMRKLNNAIHNSQRVVTATALW